jgi:DNA-binding transcriptional LysR family regulator
MQNQHEFGQKGGARMELQDVKAFVLLANLCNYQETADALFISQPTLSRHIQRLEKELGDKLFDRTTRRIRLSGFGKTFLPYAQELVCVEHNFREECRERTRQIQETLRIRAIPAMAAYRFTEILARFRTAHPQYQLEVEELISLDGLYESLTDGTADLALLHGPERWPDGIGHLTLFDDRLVAALPEGHPLSALDRLHLSALKNERFITPPRTSVVYGRFAAACGELRFTPKVDYAGHREDVMLSLVRNGFGVGVLTRRTARYAGEAGVRLVELSPELPLPVSVAYAQTPRSAAGRALFLECCRQVAQEPPSDQTSS